MQTHKSPRNFSGQLARRDRGLLDDQSMRRRRRWDGSRASAFSSPAAPGLVTILRTKDAAACLTCNCCGPVRARHCSERRNCSRSAKEFEMTILVFKDGGQEVATTVWTACAKGERVDLAYLWGGD